MLNRFLAGKEADKRGPKSRRPYLATECGDLNEADKWRQQILREIGKKVMEIQNAGLGEHRCARGPRGGVDASARQHEQQPPQTQGRTPLGLLANVAATELVAVDAGGAALDRRVGAHLAVAGAVVAGVDVVPEVVVALLAIGAGGATLAVGFARVSSYDHT